ncbi:MAG: aminopeptidase P family protein [Desulfobacula sp.]|nr:aminopeptidase P family protein [Desulfobacula sp.]
MIKFKKSTPNTELEQRISRIQKSLEAKQVDGALILQKMDLFYYSGTAQQGWLYIPSIGKPVLMIFKEFERAKAESGLDQIVSIISPKEIPGTIADFGYKTPKNLGLEMDVIPANLFLQFQKIFKESKLVDISLDIRLQRAVKSEYEIALIRESSKMSDKLAQKVPEILKEGMTEIEFAGMVEAHARNLGHQGIIRMRLWGNELFYGHIMAGPNAAVPSSLASPTGGLGLNPTIAQGSGFNLIRPNEAVLVDYVFALNGYCSDHARIFALGGLPDELLKAHDAMLDIQERVKKEAVPGAITGEIYALMLKMAKEKGYQDFFMGATERRIRFTGHGIGLELDEFPFIAQGQKLALEKNMVFALEPKVIMPGIGVVGIENTHLVTDSGLEALTRLGDGVSVI